VEIASTKESIAMTFGVCDSACTVLGRVVLVPVRWKW